MPETIVFIADPHLAANEPGAQKSYEEVLQRLKDIEGLQLVVFLGDLTMKKIQSDELFGYAREQFNRLPVPWIAIPGNQDVGNPIREDPPDEFFPRDNISTADMAGTDQQFERKKSDMITHDRLSWFSERFGPFPWRRDIGNVRILGLNSQLLGSGFEEETAQITWLREQMQARKPTVMLLHTPLYLTAPDEDDMPDRYWCVPTEPRQRFLETLREMPPDLILHGHIHRQLTIPCDFCRMQSLASTSFQSSTVWSVDTSRMPPGSDDFGFYVLNAADPNLTLTRHILDNQDRYGKS